MSAEVGPVYAFWFCERGLQAGGEPEHAAAARLTAVCTAAAADLGHVPVLCELYAFAMMHHVAT